MGEAPAATEAFQIATGEAEFETDGTMVNTRDGWMETKIGVFVKRPRGEPAEPAGHEWQEEALPALLPRLWKKFGG